MSQKCFKIHYQFLLFSLLLLIEKKDYCTLFTKIHFVFIQYVLYAFKYHVIRFSSFEGKYRGRKFTAFQGWGDIVCPQGDLRDSKRRNLATSQRYDGIYIQSHLVNKSGLVFLLEVDERENDTSASLMAINRQELQDDRKRCIRAKKK